MNDQLFDRLARLGAVAGDRRRLLQGLTGAAAAGVVGVGDGKAKRRRRKRNQNVGAASGRRPSTAVLKTMTRNIYLGADLSPLFIVTSPEELILEATQIWKTVQETDFPARAKLLAEEIADAEPHLVGLQEVSLWRTQTPSDGNSTPNAVDVEYDFLDTLLREITRQGGRYAAVATVTKLRWGSADPDTLGSPGSAADRPRRHPRSHRPRAERVLGRESASGEL